MQFTDRRINQASADFKALCVEALIESNLTQQDLADACATKQSTIAQYFSYNSYHHLPAFLVRFLPKQIALLLLQDLAAAHHCDVLPRIPIAGRLNGTLEDEVVSMIQQLSDITKEAKNKPHRFRMAAKHIPLMKEIVAQMEAELELMQRQAKAD